MKKSSLTTIILVTAVILFGFYLINKPAPTTDIGIAKCIGENSVVYEQLGCHACETQEKMFGENYKYLNTVDCFFERELCAQKNIEATPTWIIDGERLKGVQSIETLQELTGC